MNQFFTLNDTVGQKPDYLPQNLVNFGHQAENGDINAIFELSRAFYNQEDIEEDLDAALFYKSILVENFPEERDPYSCAVTLTEIALIYAEKAMLEESKEWFIKTYAFIKDNYTVNRRLYLMVNIGFFEAVVEAGFEVREIIEEAYE